jgi:hypothetical protein
MKAQIEHHLIVRSKPAFKAVTSAFLQVFKSLILMLDLSKRRE